MKELNIEGKAKANDGNYKVYTELINRLEDVKDVIKKQNYGIAMDILCKPYPKFQITTSTELKENEDIMIKKALIEHFRWNTKQILNEFSNKKVLAWLEKQGEKTEPVEDFDTEFEKQVSHLIASAINREHEYNKGYIKWVAQSLIEYAKREIEEQDIERKQLYVRFGDIPLNEKSKIYRGEEEIGYENGVSVYPAFELNGNIVLGLTLPITMTTLYTQQHLLEYDNRPCYLVNGDYIGKGTDGEPLIRNISIIKRLYDYRTKSSENQDNKDILENAVLDGNEDGLIAETIKYKNEKQDEQKLTKEHNVCNFCEDRYGCVSPCPTKLIEEQKPVDKVEPKFHEGDMIIHKELGGDYIHNPHKIIQVDILDKKYRLEGGLVAHFGEQDDYELVEQKPAWSEEDEKQARQIERIVHDDGCTQKLQKQIADWFKSLKDRVQPQPKQEWSEEDYNEIETIACHLDNIDNEGMAEILRNIRDKYYHIIPQNTWKPSKEQMEALHYVTNFDYGGHKATLVSLYEQLKKLRG